MALPRVRLTSPQTPVGSTTANKARRGKWGWAWLVSSQKRLFQRPGIAFAPRAMNNDASSNRPTVAVLFDRFGPYHLARIGSAAPYLTVVGVELSAETKEYAWDKVADSDRFRRVTVFPDGSARDATMEEVRKRLFAHLDAIKPAAVAIPGWSGRAALLALQWCVGNRVPAVMMSESHEIDEARKPILEFVKRQVLRTCSAALVGGSIHVEYLKKLGFPADRVALGYDVVDNSYFANGAAAARAEEDATRARLGLPAAYFVASNRFIAKKNLPLMLRAYAAYRKAAKDAPLRDLVLLGDGPLRAEVEAVVDQLGLRACVHLPGFRQYADLPGYYALADAFIHASTAEQWGLVVNEAMAAGLPVVVSNRCGSAFDLVQDGVNGYRFDPFNEAEFAARLGQIPARGAAWEKLSAGSRDIIAKWDQARFGEGLRDAVAMALKFGPTTGGLLPRVALSALVRVRK